MTSGYLESPEQTLIAVVEEALFDLEERLRWMGFETPADECFQAKLALVCAENNIRAMYKYGELSLSAGGDSDAH